MMLMFRLRRLLFTVFLPFFSHQCPELPFSAWFWRIFLSHHFHSLKFYCVNAGLQPTVWNNPGLARLPENKMLLLNECKRLNYLEKYFSFCPLPSCLLLPHFILFSFPFSFLLVLFLYDADESAVASVQSLGLFCADVTAALHNLCLSCLQSRSLCALTAVCCTCSDPCLPAYTGQVLIDINLQSAARVRHLLLKQMLRLFVQIIWTLFGWLGQLKET